MANWIVELEPGVYLAPTEGDPGRTLRQEHATVFASHPRARRALIEARRFRPFADGRVTLAPLVEPPNDEVRRAR